MRTPFRRAIFGSFAFILSCCAANPDEQANTLFAEAERQVALSSSQNQPEQIQTLIAVEEKLKVIVRKYPITKIAKQLTANQTVVGISLQSILRKLAVLRASQELRVSVPWTDCLTAPKRDCVLYQALQTTQAIKDSNLSDIALAEIVESVAKAGKIEQALLLAQSVQDWAKQGNLLQKIAVERASTDHFAEALRIAFSMEDMPGGIDMFSGLSRADALIAVAKQQAEHGKYASALQVIQSIKDMRWYTKALVIVSEAQVDAGLGQAAGPTLDEALNASQSIKDEVAREFWLAEVAKAQANAGRFAEAVQVAQSIKDQSLRAPTLGSILEHQAKARRLSDALAKPIAADVVQIANSLINSADPTNFSRQWERDKLLESVAEARRKSGQFADGAQIAQAIDAVYVRYDAFNFIVEASAKARRFSEAIRIAQSFQSKSSYFQASDLLLTVADEQSKAGLTVESGETAKLALNSARSTNDKSQGGRSIGAIARVQATAGNFSYALQIAQFIDDEHVRAYVLCHIAEQQGKAGLQREAKATLEQALQRAQYIETPAQAVYLLVAIGKLQAELSQNRFAPTALSLALRRVQNEKDEHAKVKELVSVADALPN